MTLPSVDMNGIDPDGNEPPDELLYRHDDDRRVELLRKGRRKVATWRVRVYDGDSYVESGYGDFAEAFGAFSKLVGTEAGVWE